MMIVTIVIVTETNVRVKNGNVVRNVLVVLIAMNGANAATDVKKVSVDRVARKEIADRVARKENVGRMARRENVDARAPRVKEDLKDLVAHPVNIAVQRHALSSQKAVFTDAMHTKSIKLQITSL
jgi:hypothetical protein